MRFQSNPAVAGVFPATPVLLCLVLVLAGCGSLSVRELMRIDGTDGVYARGHAVSARFLAGRLHYRLQAALAGKSVDLNCRHSEASLPEGRLAVSVRNCLPVGSTELDANSLLPSFHRASVELGMYFADSAVTSIEIVALPFGTRYYSSHRGWRKPDDLALKLAFWWEEGDGTASTRAAIRSFAHEFTHLAVKVERKQLPREDGELFASVFENCIEFAVFGNVSDDRDDIGDEILMERVGAESLQRSIAGSRAARSGISDWLHADSLYDVRLRCREVLDAT